MATEADRRWTMILGRSHIDRQRCMHPACGRRGDPLWIAVGALGAVAMCPRCRLARLRVLRAYYDRRTAQVAQARFWRAILSSESMT